MIPWGDADDVERCCLQGVETNGVHHEIDCDA